MIEHIFIFNIVIMELTKYQINGVELVISETVPSEQYCFIMPNNVVVFGIRIVELTENVKPFFTKLPFNPGKILTCYVDSDTLNILHQFIPSTFEYIIDDNQCDKRIGIICMFKDSETHENILWVYDPCFK